MIIKITSYDVHVRRSYFNRQNSQLFNQRIPYGQRGIQYYRVFFFFFLISPQSRRSYVFTRVVHSQSTPRRLLLGEIKKKTADTSLNVIMTYELNL
jgi:hypothetical protein